MKKVKTRPVENRVKNIHKPGIMIIVFLFTLTYSWADTFSFSGDSMTTVLARGKERTVLTGNAVIISDNTEIHAEEIILYGEDSRFAQCSGRVEVTDTVKGIYLQSENLFYDRDIDLSRVEGYAEMEDQKNELIVKGGYLENFGDDDITIIQIGVRILKEDLACRAEFARFRRDEEILELSGMPYVFWKGDDYRASRIIINLESDEIRLEGEVQGTVTTKEEKNGKDETKTTETTQETEN